MKKILPIELEIYDAQVLLAVGVSTKEVRAYVKKHANIPPSEELFEMLSCIDKDSRMLGRSILDSETSWNVLWLRRKPKKPYEIGILAHEASHITHFVLHNMGHEWSVDNDEIVAYTNGFIVRRALELLK